MRAIKVITLLIVIIATVSGCGSKQDASVVVYTSVDQHFAEEILEKFTTETGIKVKPVFDVEATKTTGLVNRLIAEKDNPIADVFWNGEIAQMLTLDSKGLLAEYSSESAKEIPEKYKSKNYTAFGGRARCFIINTDLLSAENYPTSIKNLIDGTYPADKIAIAKPLFGTTATHAAALYAYWGKEKTLDYYQQIDQQGVLVVDGNSVVRDMVAEGRLLFGLTDTDDALGAIKNNYPVKVVFPDQDGDMGTLIIPNTVALIKNAPNEDNAKLFIDWLLAKEQEKKLIESGWCQVSVRPIDIESALPIDNIKTLPVNFQQIYNNLSDAQEDLKKIFLK